MKTERMENLFYNMLSYLVEYLNDEDELRQALKSIGFRDDEINAMEE